MMIPEYEDDDLDDGLTLAQHYTRMAQQLRDRLERDPPSDPTLRDRMAADVRRWQAWADHETAADHFAAGDGDRKLF
ncbi:MAG: hypothetical protein H6515_14810 [Microthrixaceae bacterium]|jgi:hypothetical protein|nr:hypothetical protein [Microthrixaceae bacterium]